MNLHTPKWVPIMGVGVQWILEHLESNFRGQNTLDWKVPYIIRKLLKLKCLKWVCMTHLGSYNTTYGQKKGWESNWQFDSQPLKVRNHLVFLLCRWRVTYHWKVRDEGYNFALDFISVGGSHTKLWAPKVARIPTLGISRLPIRSPDTKWHLGAGPVAMHITYYMGEGGGFP
jgi:hypothetical protein